MSNINLENSVLTQMLVKCYYMSSKDVLNVRSFLDTCRNSLERIEFFYPYKNEELEAVINGGHFLGAFKDEKLIGTVGLDLDKNYASQIAKIISDCTLKTLNPTQAYEVSGLMVNSDYRGLGLANHLVQQIVKEARSYCDYVCSVVQLENEASMKTFLKNGFVLAGVYQMGGPYDFGYFLKDLKNDIKFGDIEESVSFRDVEGHLKQLSKSRVGVKIGNGCVLYAGVIK